MKMQNIIIYLFLSIQVISLINCQCYDKESNPYGGYDFFTNGPCEEETDFSAYGSVLQNGSNIQIELNVNSSSSPSYVRNKTLIRKGSFSGDIVDFTVSGSGYSYTLTPTSPLQSGVTYFIIFKTGTFSYEDWAVFTITWS